MYICGNFPSCQKKCRIFGILGSETLKDELKF